MKRFLELGMPCRIITAKIMDRRCLIVRYKMSSTCKGKNKHRASLTVYIYLSDVISRPQPHAGGVDSAAGRWKTDVQAMWQDV